MIDRMKIYIITYDSYITSNIGIIKFELPQYKDTVISQNKVIY